MPRPPAPVEGEKSTRERILDVALELFTHAGYEAVSLREIAQRMNFTKAALYYHFSSKDDILLALHLRLHDLGRAGYEDLEADLTDPDRWPAAFDLIVSTILAHRTLILFHLRNHSALERLAPHHDNGDHADLQERLRLILADEAVPIEVRVRLTCALGAIAGGFLFGAEVFAGIGDDDLGRMVRAAVGDLVAAPGRATGGPPAGGE
ncbi:TetR family transcriptional regulator [Parafrankia colletiae]|uniref:TetR family transcriptional regulator n=1 Tax=Parafrankia colletiae TaxID=573497 RepID=A0A1S1QIJ0_9ACTN|nr:TetR/AcrR family transcriptional regulator [Parafrankia colletiae]MCK9901472.1 TetR/AcrR family transcriptional regulator [Frankia sp. Cpl3]OHV33487.1 TetR family transcriptional regulator [Parafrankia colletiae]